MTCREQGRRRRKPPDHDGTTVSLYGEPGEPCPTCLDTQLWMPMLMPGVPLNDEPQPCPTCTTC